MAAKLDEARADHRDLDRFVRRLAERLEEMTKTDEIAHAVAVEIHDQARRRLTFSRKLAGALVALVMLVPAVHDAVGWFS